MSEKKNILNSIIDDVPSFVSDREIEDSILEDIREELDIIRDPKVLSFVRSLLLKAEEFWVIPGSFASVHHPPDEDAEGGNLIHTKRVVRTALILCEQYKLPQEEVDLIIAACILHDLTKGVKDYNGVDIGYDQMHPYTVDAFVEHAHRQDMLNADSQSSVMHVSSEVKYAILRLIRCHEGPNSPIPETFPVTVEEMIVCQANAIASRLHWIVDGDEILMDRWLL